MNYMREVNKALGKIETKGKNLFVKEDDSSIKFKKNIVGPEHIFEATQRSEIDGIICSKGLAEKYGDSYKTNLILRANGDVINSFKNSKDLYSPISCSIKVAVDLDAKAISFTNFVGSCFQEKIVEDFRKTQEEAHDFGLPILSFIKGSNLKDDDLLKASKESMDMGADIIVSSYNSHPMKLKEQVVGIGNTRLCIENEKDSLSSKDILNQVKETNDLGSCGYVCSNAVLGHENPKSIIKSIRDVQIRGKDIYSALKRLEK